MTIRIGIRREDKNIWERRTPLIPDHIKTLKENYDIRVVVQPSKIRVFDDDAYAQVGAVVQDDLSECNVIFAVKEIPIELIEHGKVYVFFSHTIKGQRHNMPLLKRLLERKCTLIDYEKVVDENSKRLIFFGHHAGLAGMIDALWALGLRLNWEGIHNPFINLRQTIEYTSLVHAKNAVKEVGELIEAKGIPDALVPLVCGLTGYGNVSRGAQEILGLLPVVELGPEELLQKFKILSDNNVIYKVVFKEEHMVEPRSPEDRFDLQDYYDYPEKYRSRFHTYVPCLTLLVNCIYWSSQYPRLITKELLKQLYSAPRESPRLRVIGDISCDVEGSIEATVHTTTPGNPIFVYDPIAERAIDGYKGRGPVILAVDNLPCELAKEASTEFSKVLSRFIPEIATADFSTEFNKCNLSPPIKNAVIAYRGELTPNYKYLAQYL
jgi:alpha-aminoadipic semialdehyde synthase